MLKLTIPVADIDTLRQLADLLEEGGFLPEFDRSETQPSAPIAATPPAVATPTVPATSNVPTPASDFDSEGLPWDERIHASSRRQTKNGAWVKRRGIEQSTYDAVVLELKTAMGEGAPTPPATATQPLPAATIPVPGAEPQVPQGVPPIPGVNVPVPGAQASEETPRFTDLVSAITHLTQLVQNKVSDQTHILAHYQQCGFNPAADAQNLEKVIEAIEYFESL